MPYWEGRSNSLWILPPLIPADTLPLLALFISFLCLLGILIRSLIRRQNRLEVTWMFSATLIFVVVWLSIVPMARYHRGFTHYVKTVLTPDEWRDISRFAQTHLQPGEWLFGPRRQKKPEDRDLWAKFTTSTQIEKLDTDFALIHVESGSTTISWGGGLVGHRGVIVYSDGSRKESEDPPHFFRSTFIADDILVFVSSD